MDEIKPDGFDTFYNWHFIDEPYIPLKDITINFDDKVDNSLNVT